MAQGKDDKKASKNIDRPMAKVVKDNKNGYAVIGKTSKKVLHNQSKGNTDVFDQEDRDGGATRTSRGPKK